MLIRCLSVHDHVRLMRTIKKLHGRSPNDRRAIYINVHSRLSRAFSERSYERLDALSAMMLDEFGVELFLTHH